MRERSESALDSAFLCLNELKLYDKPSQSMRDTLLLLIHHYSTDVA